MNTEPKEDGVTQPAATPLSEHHGGEIPSSKGMPPIGEDVCAELTPPDIDVSQTTPVGKDVCAELNMSLTPPDIDVSQTTPIVSDRLSNQDNGGEVDSVDGPNHEKELNIKGKDEDNDEDEKHAKVTVIVPPEGVLETPSVGVLGTSTEVETPNGKEHISQDMKVENDSSVDTPPLESDHSQEPEAMEEEEKKEEPLAFPSTLEGFQYKFDDEGKLRHIKTEETFLFEVKKGNHRYNQAHYEALGDVLTKEVYRLLETRGKLFKHYLPVDASEDDARSFFFMSEGAEKAKKLLILIHGSGVVRAGQWARSLIINNNLDSGTQLLYIERGLKEGYGIMVLNTNLNYAEARDGMQPIRDNSSPQEHASYVWKEFVKQSKAHYIDIVAHSFGGVVTIDLACEFTQDFYERVHKIAFTDSVHSLMSSRITRRMSQWIKDHCVNWVSSRDELGTKQKCYFNDNDVPCRSAGTLKHVETSWKSFEAVFQYLTEATDDDEIMTPD